MDSKSLRVFVLFALSYAALFLLSFMNRAFGSPMQIQYFDFSTLPWHANYSLYLLPVAGFFMVYMLIPYLTSEFGFGKLFTKRLFPFLVLIFSVLGFMLAVYVYYLDVGLRSGLGFDISAFNVDYASQFFTSSFFYFMLAGLCGWASRMLIEKFPAKQ